MSGSGRRTERLARRMVKRARDLKVPTVRDDDAPIPSRVDFARSAGIEPDQWQGNVLESAAQKILLNCCRQSGKSTTSGVLAAHEACFVPNSLALMLAPSLRQSGELFRTTLNLIKRSDLTLPAIVSESALRCELENGSRIIALPATEATTRGYPAVTLLVIDEAARVPDSLIAAVRPALATTNGRMIALTTPNGKRGFFYLEWASGIGYERTQITAKECLRISKEFLDDELRILGPHRFAQEYECVFMDSDTSVFSSDLIEAALCDIQSPWSFAA